MKHIITLLTALMLLSGCGNSEPHAEGDHEHAAEEHGHDHEEGAADSTIIPAATAQSMGVVTSVAGPGRIKEQLSLSGTIQADPARVSRVRARYPGVVREVAVQPWAKVANGALLARVQSNESLQNYALNAPIGGVIVEHRAQIGESTGEDTLFTLVDLSKVWVELDVFQTDLDRVAEGQPVDILDLDGRRLADGRIIRIAPLAIHGSQSVRARVIIDNASGNLRPGQFVTGRTVIAEAEVPLLIEKTALQRFRDADVVYEQIGDSYEARAVKLGRADGERVEVLAGLQSGARYVTSNSYLIKADIEKAGASHDH
jgi:cobalt-zinc-cadmium efflux system membrane fusion protein